MPSPSSDASERSVATDAPTPRRWIRWARLRRTSARPPEENQDQLVAIWKAAWLKGARAQWAAAASDANPYAADRERMAWDAGWRWAQQHPDRRTDNPPRIAHRRRRASDSSAHLTRTLGLGAVGVTVFLISRAVHRWAKAAPRP